MLAFLILAAPLFAPQLLFFPYRAETEIGTIWAESPIDEIQITEVASQAKSLIEASPIASPSEQRSIFLTEGGWRWTWIVHVSRDAFAITRPLTDAVVVNQSDIASNEVVRGATIGGARSLHSVLAHEFTHGMIRARYGEFASMEFPNWKVEGYCDHVARESSLTDQEVAELESSGADHPALPYYYGRRRVAEILMANGGSVDDLFESGF